MVPPARTPLRPDRLRALNLPVSVMVVSDGWGMPTEVVETDGSDGGTDDDGTTVRRYDGTAERRNGGTDIRPTAEQRSAGPPGSGGRVSGDRRVEGKGDGGPPGWSVSAEGDRRVAERGEVGPPGGAGRRVEEVVEVWVVQDEWWRNPIHRRYVEVVLEGGAHVVLFEDLVTGEWFMQQP